MMTVSEQSFVLDSLRSCPLFARVDADALMGVVRRLRQRRFRRNEVIFHQGDPGDALYVITEGAVKIVLPSPEGEEAIIATLRAGDFFGELALLDGEPHSATATAVEPTETLSLPRDVFLDLMGREPDLRDALLKGIAAELRRLTGHVEELHFLDLAGRLAKRLRRLAEDQTPGASGEFVLDWPYTQSDLAAMIGGTRQSVNKLLAELVEKGLIVIDRDRLVIHDLEALARRAGR
jgi:CRP/FNR family cyclic AMP-dependent transcriptional regulator